ncbi:uncharacterized protein LOC122850436 [Aphidius gifuensis]|uniref:uncharacterized protein LOC122850436 n=1 Tax=Aphidius gifuensis TaxID=684658 RepID=UPI001CDD13B1|nr:uncharacterized protein LOC122850436 [Aphidius gifuensis]
MRVTQRREVAKDKSKVSLGGKRNKIKEMLHITDDDDDKGGAEELVVKRRRRRPTKEEKPDEQSGSLVNYLRSKSEREKKDSDMDERESKHGGELDMTYVFVARKSLARTPTKCFDQTDGKVESQGLSTQLDNKTIEGGNEEVLEATADDMKENRREEINQTTEEDEGEEPEKNIENINEAGRNGDDEEKDWEQTVKEKMKKVWQEIFEENWEKIRKEIMEEMKLETRQMQINIASMIRDSTEEILKKLRSNLQLMKQENTEIVLELTREIEAAKRGSAKEVGRANENAGRSEKH